jgi:hypothetical protein
MWLRPSGRTLDFIHFESNRPVRDDMNLARHFSAGTSENMKMSPVRDD